MKPSVKIKTAEYVDSAELRTVWKEAFGDSDAYLDFFFAFRFCPENTLVLLENGKIVSQLFLLPCFLRGKDDIVPCYYLFAAATLKSARGKGYMGALLKAAESLSAERNVNAIVLLPGEPSLYDYYKRFGYSPCFKRKFFSGSRIELSGLAESAETVGAMQALPGILSSRQGVIWNSDALHYALSEHEHYRGHFAASNQAFVTFEDESQLLLYKSGHFGEAVSLLLRNSDKSDFSLVLPPDAPIGTPVNGGMVRFIKEEIQISDAFLCFAME